jgi:hypothetical protein
MDVLGDLVARSRRSPAPAFRDDAHDRSYTYHDFCTTAWKTGNFLRYLGVARGDRVEIAPEALAEPVLTFFGAAQLGAVTRFAPGSGDARAVVVPQGAESTLDPPPGTKLAVFGGPPSRPDVAHWEGIVWSENPAFPPTDVDPDSPALSAVASEDPDAAEADLDDQYTHAELLDGARRVVDRFGVDEETTVALRASLARPGAVVGGVLAPLLAGGTVVLPDDDTLCDVCVGDGPEPVQVAPDELA